MEKNRRVKILSIIALGVALCALTIGFAAFSTTLTISSSASVDPSSENFKIVAYGFVGDTVDSFLNDFDNNKSLTQVRVISDFPSGELVITDKFATINKLSISDVSVSLSQPGMKGTIYFQISNEGEYDAYFDTSQFNNVFSPSCELTDDSDATLELVEAACDYIEVMYVFSDSDSWDALRIYGIESEEFATAMSNNCFNNRDSVCKLEKGDRLYVQFSVEYAAINGEAALADGPFVAKFDPITFDFTTNNTGFES